MLSCILVAIELDMDEQSLYHIPLFGYQYVDDQQRDPRVVGTWKIGQAAHDTQLYPMEVGPWRIHDKIDEGVTGIVRIAKHTITGLLAAVKVVAKPNTLELQQKVNI